MRVSNLCRDLGLRSTTKHTHELSHATPLGETPY
jgi:hypothetical protein